jgi:hypothetical protein
MWTCAEECLNQAFDRKTFQTLVAEEDDLRRSTTIDYTI